MIYKYHLERSRVLTKYGLPGDMQEIIEVRLCLADELPSLFVKHLLGMGKSSYSKKHKTKKMKVCHKYTKWNCDARCKNPRFISINREDKFWCIKDRLSKESLDDVRQSLKARPSRDVHSVLLDLFQLF